MCISCDNLAGYHLGIPSSPTKPTDKSRQVFSPGQKPHTEQKNKCRGLSKNYEIDCGSDLKLLPLMRYVLFLDSMGMNSSVKFSQCTFLNCGKPSCH